MLRQPNQRLFQHLGSECSKCPERIKFPEYLKRLNLPNVLSVLIVINVYEYALNVLNVPNALK